MLRNYLAAALRNLVRNWIYAGVNIIGLAVGFAAAIFATLFVRDQTTFNRWIPGIERTYTIGTTLSLGARGTPPVEQPYVYRDVGATIALDIPEVEAAGRLMGEGIRIVEHGDVRAAEDINVGDPNIFKVLPFPRVAGDLDTALAQPDGIVITRGTARKYFGREAPIGETLTIDQHPMRVNAVIEDIPVNTSLAGVGPTLPIIISGLAPFSRLSGWDAQKFGPEIEPWQMVFGGTYVRLKPAASPDAVDAAMPAYVERHIPRNLLGDVKMRLLPLASFNLVAIHNDSTNLARLVAALFGVAAIAVLIVIAAVINFVNATTARAARRAVEVGVRKATGAARRQLMVQFLGELMIYAAIAAVVALLLVALLMPAFRAMLDRNIVFDLWSQSGFAGGIFAAALVTGLLAGVYPALILASFRPAAVLKSSALRGGRSTFIRQTLVMVQFAILIGVTVVAAVIARQTEFALNDSLRFDKDQVVVVQNGCRAALDEEVRQLPGVRAASCGSIVGASYTSSASGKDGRQIAGWQDISFSPVDVPFFEVFGLTPIAGRFFARDRGEDVAAAGGSSNPSVVINETAVRKLGFGSPGAAIGETILWRRMAADHSAIDTQPMLPSRIIGVVADVNTQIGGFLPAQIYYVDRGLFHAEASAQTMAGGNLSIKLTGHDIPETLAAIDQLWAKVDARFPIRRRFLEDQLEQLYRDLIRQRQVIVALGVVALFIASLGLFGLSAFTAESRTKEIGVRKALGARRRDILRLLAWEFAKPVLWANALAWPAAYLVTRRWLAGFAAHVSLDAWIFVAASGLALAIAMATIAGHALVVARAQPVTALRYE